MREATPRRSWADAAPDIVTGVLGAALVLFGLWGLWVVADVARPLGDPNPNIAAAERNLTAFKFFLTWLVLFAPFFFLGAAILWSTFKKHYATSRIWGLMGVINQITPFWMAQSRYARLADQFQRYDMEKPAPAIAPPERELDDETIRRVDRAGYLAAKTLGLVVGGLLAAAGLVGFIYGWLDVHHPASYSMWYDRSALRFSMAFLIFCAAAAVVGVAILRDTFRPEESAWLAPLRAFGYIVGLRAVADILKREQEEQARTLPGHGPQKSLPSPGSSDQKLKGP